MEFQARKFSQNIEEIRTITPEAIERINRLNVYS